MFSTLKKESSIYCVVIQVLRHLSSWTTQDYLMQAIIRKKIKAAEESK